MLTPRISTLKRLSKFSKTSRMPIAAPNTAQGAGVLEVASISACERTTLG